jgi:uncharacterized protein (DUF885 family)
MRRPILAPLLLALAVSSGARSEEPAPTLRSVVGQWWTASMLPDRGDPPVIPFETSEERVARLKGVQAQIAAFGAVEEPDRSTAEMATALIDAEIAMEACHIDRWYPPRLEDVSGLGTYVGSTLARLEMVKRYSEAPDRVNAVTERLRGALSEGRVADAETLAERVAEADRALAAPGAVLKPRLPSPLLWSQVDVQRFNQGIDAAAPALREAVEGWRAFLQDEALPKARKTPGLTGLADGRACYAAHVQWATSEPHTAEELDRLGRAKVKAARSELLAWGASRGLTSMEALRKEGAAGFADVDTMLAEAQRLASLSRPAASPYTARELPVPRVTAHDAGCVAWVTRRGGIYLEDTATRVPRVQLPAIVFHEGYPGHLLQLEFAAARSDLPSFRRYGYLPAFSEGWALYAEGLAGELGLYTSDEDQLGVLAMEAWRSARIVVDVGLHDRSWTVEQAEAYFRENTLVPDDAIRCDVRRALDRPAQGLGYVMGRDAIRELRAEAERDLGARFDRDAFHRAVLQDGVVTLPVLRRRVREWIAGSR